MFIGIIRIETIIEEVVSVRVTIWFMIYLVMVITTVMVDIVPLVICLNKQFWFN